MEKRSRLRSITNRKLVNTDGVRGAKCAEVQSVQSLQSVQHESGLDGSGLAVKSPNDFNTRPHIRQSFDVLSDVLAGSPGVLHP